MLKHCLSEIAGVSSKQEPWSLLWHSLTGHPFGTKNGGLKYQQFSSFLLMEWDMKSRCAGRETTPKQTKRNGYAKGVPVMNMYLYHIYIFIYKQHVKTWMTWTLRKKRDGRDLFWLKTTILCGFWLRPETKMPESKKEEDKEVQQRRLVRPWLLMTDEVCTGESTQLLGGITFLGGIQCLFNVLHVTFFRPDKQNLILLFKK